MGSVYEKCKFTDNLPLQCVCLVSMHIPQKGFNSMSESGTVRFAMKKIITFSNREVQEKGSTIYNHFG